MTKEVKNEQNIVCSQCQSKGCDCKKCPCPCHTKGCWSRCLGKLVPSIIIALGLVSIGKGIQWGLSEFKLNRPQVVVKGISERDVIADLASWVVKYQNTGMDLATLQQKQFSDEKIIMEFLKAVGFKDSEMEQGISQIKDRVSQDYVNTDILKTSRFLGEGSIVIRSTNIKLIQKAATDISQLSNKEVIVSGSPKYYFTGFKDLRPLMIEEATKDARRAAQKFAADSGVKVGSILHAHQGSFSIMARDFAKSDTSSDYNEDQSIHKTVRVVSTITFSLE